MMTLFRGAPYVGSNSINIHAIVFCLQFRCEVINDDTHEKIIVWLTE